MPFRDLYEAAQNQTCQISTKWLKAKAIDFSEITLIREQWSGNIDPKSIRGFYIEGPMGPPMTLAQGQSLIVLSREMCNGHEGKYWRRWIFTKELMHVFDTDEEKASSPETFESQIQKFGNPSAPRLPQFTAELKAFWRAVAVLCTEGRRKEIKDHMGRNGASIAVLAASLRLPIVCINALISPKYEEILKDCLD